MTPEPPSWLALVADQERSASEWNAQIRELQKLRGNLDPARIPPPPPPRPPEAPPEPLPIWCTLPEIPKDAPAQLKRKLRRQHAAAAKKELRKMPPAPQLPANAVESMYRKMRRAAAFYVQRRLVELCPPRGTLTRAQARGVLHKLCLQIRADALGGALRDQAHAAAQDPGAERLLLSLADGDLEHAARADLRHLYRNDRWIGWWILRALALQKKALLDRVADNELWFPVILASPAEVESTTTADNITDTKADITTDIAAAESESTITVITETIPPAIREPVEPSAYTAASFPLTPLPWSDARIETALSLVHKELGQSFREISQATITPDDSSSLSHETIRRVEIEGARSLKKPSTRDKLAGALRRILAEHQTQIKPSGS